ncbi:MAG TPA: tetratricopeptide repeat protein [Vicinamibacteria bacterium]|nr:tetratricopeptide repeat protein [Vicinamibacteria bacterium]
MAKINPIKVKADADKLEKAGQTDKAIALYKQVVDDNPKDWNTVNKIGDLYAKLNKPREASAEYAKVADFYAKDGFLLKAIAIWKKINKLDASAMEPYLNLADLYAKQGLMMEAKAQYQIVVDEYIKRGRNREAGDVLKKLAEIDPADLKVRSKLADLYTRGGDNKRAVEEHIAIADELNKKGHVAEALQVLEKGLKLDPANTRLKGEVARVHLLQKNYDKAVAFLEQTLQAAPNDKELLGRLGEAYLGAKKVADAESTFKRLLELDPRDEEARVQMGRVRLFQGNYDAAYDDFLPVVERLLEKRDADKAAALLQQIVQRAPGHIKSLLKLVDIYRFAKNERSVAATYSQLSEAYINDGQLQQAVSVLETLVEREPHNQQHRSKLDFVRKKLAGGEAAAPARRPAPQPEVVEEELELGGVTPQGSAPLSIEEPPARAEPAPAAASAARAEAPAAPGKVQISGPLSEEDTEFIEEHLAEGKVFRKYGLVDKAADQFEAILARFSDNIEARQELREVYREKGLNTKAAEQSLALAEIYRLQGNEAEGRKNELEAHSLDPQLVESRAPAAAAAPRPSPAAAEPAEVAQEELALAQEEPPLAQQAAAREEEIALEGEEEISLEEAPETPPEEIGLEVPEEAAVSGEIPAEALPPLEAEPAAAAAPSAPEEEIATAEDIGIGEEISVGAEAPPEEIGFAAEEIPLEPPAEESRAAPVRVAAAPPPPPPPQAAVTAPLKAAPAPAAYVEETPTARTLAADLQRVLSEVDSYIALGFVDDAKDALREVAMRYPAHPAILSKLDELGLDREALEGGAGAEEVAPPPPPPSAAVEEEPVFPLPAEEPPPRPAAAAPPAAAPFESPFEGGIDLGAELNELFGAQSAVEEVPVETTASELGDSGLADIFREFKKGVDKQLGKEDYDTRYNLGIAYKEMGLIDEAIAEFQLAAKDENRALECGSMLGICFMEKGMPKLAIKWFEKGLKAPGRSEEEYAALRYDLAMAYEASGEVDRALDIFTDLYGQDANFRDVAAKVRELRSASR